MPTQRVFLDTNVIIECFRIGVWAQLSHGVHLETVEECYREALTGETSRPTRVHVDADALRAGLKAVHLVGRRERNALLAKHAQMDTLDAGERDLFAHLAAHATTSMPQVLLSTADKAALVRAQDLHLLDRLVSLETLLNEVGVPRSRMVELAPPYSTDFLEVVRVKIRLGVIP